MSTNVTIIYVSGREESKVFSSRTDAEKYLKKVREIPTVASAKIWDNKTQRGF